MQLYVTLWSVLKWIGSHVSEARKLRIYERFGPTSIVFLLGAWAGLQVCGFGLIWWGLGGLSTHHSLSTSLYYSGIVYFTVGFGEIVPEGLVPRVGAIAEALTGVLSVALLIGFVPAMYDAFSRREEKLITLDDGSENHIRAANLLIARCPDGVARDAEEWFAGWESWIAEIIETHRCYAMLMLLRSQRPGQNWIAALRLITETAVLQEACVDGRSRSGYWVIRRAASLLNSLTEDMHYKPEPCEMSEEAVEEFRLGYLKLQRHGFDLHPYEESLQHARDLHHLYDPQLNFLVEVLDVPSGFWGDQVGHNLASTSDD